MLSRISVFIPIRKANTFVGEIDIIWKPYQCNPILEKIYFNNSRMGRDLVIGCYKYTNIPNSTWGVAIGKKRAETTILRHSMPK